MQTLSVIYFTAQKKRFAVKDYNIKGLEDSEIGSVLITDDARIPIDEDFETAYNRINGLEPYEDGALSRVDR